jgi:SSS family solute:Na+ symporter
VIFAVQAALLVPYIIIAMVGGGTTLATVTNGLVPYAMGGAIVSFVIMGYVFFGGMRGTAWVNAFQTILFLLFGTIAVATIAYGMGGFRSAMQDMLASSATAPLLTRERVSPLYFLSYTFIPLSSIAFPHIAIFCMTARRVSYFRRTVVLYPICMLAIWLPSVFLGVVANRATDVPAVAEKLEARRALASPDLPPDDRTRLQSVASGDDVILHLVAGYAPTALAALLAAAVMAAVMASDSQILALSTMFTEDVFAYYGGRRRFGERVQVATGRAFVVGLTLVAYVISLTTPPSIFALATQYAFAGYAGLAPLLVAALFWRGSTKWGALAATLWCAAAVVGVAIVQNLVPPPPPGQAVAIVSIGGLDLVTRVTSGTMTLGFLPVVPITLLSVVLLFLVSWLTPSARPAAATLDRYFAPAMPPAVPAPSRTLS